MNGTTFWATKPPRLPTELIAAIPAAAVAPRRKVAGHRPEDRLGREGPGRGHAQAGELHGVARQDDAERQARRPDQRRPDHVPGQGVALRACAGGVARDPPEGEAVTTQGMMLRKPFVRFETPKPLTMVGSQ